AGLQLGELDQGLDSACHLGLLTEGRGEMAPPLPQLRRSDQAAGAGMSMVLTPTPPSVILEASRNSWFSAASTRPTGVSASREILKERTLYSPSISFSLNAMVFTPLGAADLASSMAASS